ncbi:MAG: serine/threonine transporter SstT [Lachnospiraceae bacterium]|nr:serine/threonine transporter SstT [Lachnospiraceae bacterium]
MKSIITKWNSMSLILRIVIGLVIGAVLGIALPGVTAIGILGTVFVGALKAIAPVLVFVLVASALANAQGNIGARFRSVIALYLSSTILAAVLAVIGSFLFPVTMILNVAAADNTPPGGIGEVLTNILTSMVSNPVGAIVNGNYVGILFWAIIFGFGLKKLATAPTKKVIAEFSDVATYAVHFVISLAPFGVLGLVFQSVSENGLGIFTTYGKLILLLVGCMALVALVVDPLIVFLAIRRNPYPLVFTCLKESGITAFFTRSSAANIPVNMQLCEKLGLESDFYSVSIPLGSTINMDGAAVTITVMTLAACHTLGITVDIPTALLLSLLAAIGACGTSGVAGGSLLLIPMAASLFGITNDIAMQVVAVGFIISVIQDSVETALNSSGDVMFTAAAEYHDRLVKGEPMNYLGKPGK